ncbi:MAG: hypothetical protein ACO3LM_09890, partial [Steroidobacteraceae bacterium]
GCLLLAESSGDYVFQELLQSGQVGRWHIRETHDEPHSAIATCDGRSLAMIAGRQIRTAENLEVLALGTVRDYPDGLELAETLELVHDSAAVAVLPWGLGKWTGARLATLTELLKWVRPDALFLGDNGGRLGIIDAPPLLVAAQSNGFRILPGSDPFPLPGDWKRVGSFGFRADIDLPDRDPWRVLRDWLTARASSPAPYGQPLGLMRFLYNQIGIQVLNRWKRVRA